MIFGYQYSMIANLCFLSNSSCNTAEGNERCAASVLVSVSSFYLGPGSGNEGSSAWWSGLLLACLHVCDCPFFLFFGKKRV